MKLVLDSGGRCELCSHTSTRLTAVTENDKNNFTSRAQHRLIDLGLSVADLARQIKRPRSTVSRAIHSNKFPKVRARVAKKLGIELAA